MTPGRKFSTMTSAPAARERARVRPGSPLRSIATLRLLRLTAWKYVAWP
jgi:hypothetical protein